MAEKKKLFTHIDNGVDEVKKSGEKIFYLILLKGSYEQDGTEYEWKDWIFITGRQAVYDYIKDYLKSELAGGENEANILDIDNSFIYAENPLVKDSPLKLSNGVTLYEFMKDCYVLQKVDLDDTFDIDDYKTYDSIPDNDEEQGEEDV